MQLHNTHVLDRDGLVAFFGSTGWISSLPEDDRVHLLGLVRSALLAADYEMSFITHVYSTRLRRDT